MAKTFCFYWKLKNQNSRVQILSIIYPALLHNINTKVSQDIDFKITWKIEKKAYPYKIGSSDCNLCAWEKTSIAKSNPKTTLNSRYEIFHKCREKTRFKLRNYLPPQPCPGGHIPRFFLKRDLLSKSKLRSRPGCETHPISISINLHKFCQSLRSLRAKQF